MNHEHGSKKIRYCSPTPETHFLMIIRISGSPVWSQPSKDGPRWTNRFKWILIGFDPLCKWPLLLQDLANGEGSHISRDPHARSMECYPVLPGRAYRSIYWTGNQIHWWFMRFIIIFIQWLRHIAQASVLPWAKLGDLVVEVNNLVLGSLECLASLGHWATRAHLPWLAASLAGKPPLLPASPIQRA